MSKYKYIYIINLFLILIFILMPSLNSAKEILLYADSISYDNEENIIARGNAKIFQDDKLIFSDLIIINKIDGKIILPTKFTFKDEGDNYFEGENGYFIKNLAFAEFENPKIRLEDGSRLIGKKLKRNGKIDIISKGVYTPCNSRIKIGNFICPTWQLEGEKILHDNDNLFLYQKHSKMRVLNTPVFYIPYIVTPSPLRKERKSGFLTPSIALNLWKQKNEIQNISLHLIKCNVSYFNLLELKEIRSNLGKVSIINNLDIKALSYKNIEYDINYYGDQKKLIKILELNKLKINFNKNKCVISLI